MDDFLDDSHIIGSFHVNFQLFEFLESDYEKIFLFKLFVLEIFLKNSKKNLE